MSIDKLSKVKDPQSWPVSEDGRLQQTLRKVGFSCARNLELSHRPFENVLDEKLIVNTDVIGFVLDIAPERPPRPSREEVRSSLKRYSTVSLKPLWAGSLRLVCYRPSQRYSKSKR